MTTICTGIMSLDKESVWIFVVLMIGTGIDNKNMW